MARDLRILVTGGGTGGHTAPAIATVAAIRKLLSERQDHINPVFLYVGSEAGLESRMARESGLDFVAIATGKLRRSSNPLRMINTANVRDAFRVPLGFLQAVKVVRGFRPDVIFSTGGYVSVPAVFAAKILHRPVLMHEQTVQIGLANQWSAHVAARIALSYEESAQELNSADQKKAFVTGGVVRQVVLGGNPESARERYGFTGENSKYPVIYVTGGAQGSNIINKSILEALPGLLAQCCIIHQCGSQRQGTPQDEELLNAARENLPEALRGRYFITKFVGDEIGDVYALADLIIGRSGAGTVSEACAVGKPAIFVPLVPTGGDEQTKNAKRLAAIGAAVIITQSEINGAVLVERVTEMLNDQVGLKAMGDAARTQASPDAAKVLAQAIVVLGLNRSKS